MTKWRPRFDVVAHKRELIIVLAVLVVGIGTLLLTKAATITTSFQAEGGTSSGNVATFGAASASGNGAIKFGVANSCGRTVQNYTYQVPFGNAVWNQPVCSLPKYGKSDHYAKVLVEWAHKNDGSPSADVNDGVIGANPGFPEAPTLFDPDGLYNLFTREVYLASKATTERQVMTTEFISNLDGIGYNPNPNQPLANAQSFFPDGKIPWNPNWKTGMAGDNEIVILDDRPGKEGVIYTIWGYNRDLLTCAVNSSRVCGASISIGRDHYGNVYDYRTYEGYESTRGVGLSYYATLTTPDEVAAGEIRHALGISIPNTSYGPDCTLQQLGTAAEGTTCGTALAPASKFEWGGASSIGGGEPYASLYTLDKTIPEGMRFALNMTYTQIDQWAATTWPNNARRQETAKIFARAIKDYGMIVVDTNGARPDIQMAGGVNPDNATKWKNLAMGPDLGSNDLLKSLLKTSNVWVVEPPTLTCANGTTSKNYCQWLSARY